MASWLPCRDSSTIPLTHRRPQGAWAATCPGEGSWSLQPDPGPPTPPCPSLWCVSPPNPGLPLCRGSSWVASPAAEPPSSPAPGPCLSGTPGLGQWEDGAPPCGAYPGEPAHRSVLREGNQGSSRFGAQCGAKQSQARSTALGVCTASASAGSKPGVPLTVVAAKGSGAEEAGRGSQGEMSMAPWQTPDRDQLTAKYLIRPFALTQPAWLPWSNRVSCTCATAEGCPLPAGGVAWGCQPVPLLHAHPPSILTALRAPTGSPLLPHACGCTHCRTQTPTVVHSSSPHRQPRGCERLSQSAGQRQQPLRCFTTHCGSLSPMKYICGSACGDKLLNCVCGRFMVRRDGGGQAGGPRCQPPSPSQQGRRACEGGSGARAGGTVGTTCKPSVNNPATDLQVIGRLASTFPC